MGIHVHDIKEWLDLLKQSRDELLRVYGERLVKGVPLYNKLDDAIKRSKK